MMETPLKVAIVIAFTLRMALMIYGLYQDQIMTIKYTDIDYSVFTDASEFMLRGQSPYKRSTYRYTPILAFLLQLNHVITQSFGKILFCASDIIVTLLSYLTVKKNCNVMNADLLLASCCCWLFNPLSLTVSSRGNAESLILVFVVAFLYFLTKANLTTSDLIISGLLYGFSIHLKIYPACYCLAIYFFINCNANNSSKVLRLIAPSTKAIIFGLSASAMLLVLTGIFYLQYGQEFLHETYLYHITRNDVKHNFSPYFYLLYLSSSHSNCGRFVSLIAFIPQVVLLICISIRYHKDVVFACFVETFAFVSFNKVCTSQYFLWYLGLLPLVLWKINMTATKALKLFLLWIFSQALWLFFAYLLEFQGYNSFFCLWIASLVFLVVNSFTIYQICLHYLPTSIKDKDS